MLEVKYYSKKIFFIAKNIFLLICMLVLFSCAQSKTKIVKPQLLFFLPLGTLPGEYKHWNSNINSTNLDFLAIREGIFYLANGNRILKLSSSGYLIDLIANYPVLNKSIDSSILQNTDYQSASNTKSTFGDIKYYQYYLQTVDQLAIDSQDRLLFSNTVINPYDRNIAFESTTENSLVINLKNKITNILLYDNNKIYQDWMREGELKELDAVVSLHTQKNDNIVLIIKNEKLVYSAFIIDKNGRLIKKIIFPHEQFPKYDMSEAEKNRIYENDKNKIFGIIKSIVPSYKKNYLYVQYEYYLQVYESYGESISNIDSLGSRVYRVNIENGSYDKKINIPTQKFRDQDFELKKVLLNENLIFTSYINERLTSTLSEKFSPQILILKDEGNIAKEVILTLPDIEFYNFNMAIDLQGNIGGYLLLKDRLEMYWWKI